MCGMLMWEEFTPRRVRKAPPGELICVVYQTTEANGSVMFGSIFPGWYSGRTVHIHIMVRTFSTSGTEALEFTTQLFFDPVLTLAVMAKAPLQHRR